MYMGSCRHLTMLHAHDGAGVGPTERGVDISAIQKIANGKWKQLI